MFQKKMTSDDQITKNYDVISKYHHMLAIGHFIITVRFYVSYGNHLLLVNQQNMQSRYKFVNISSVAVIPSGNSRR